MMVGKAPELALHLTSPLETRELRYRAAGQVRPLGKEHPPEGPAVIPDSPLPIPHWEGFSIRIRSLVTGLCEEVFLDGHGSFAQEIELQPESDNPLEFTICDETGEERAQVVVCVRHREKSHLPGPDVLPVQVIAKPLQRVLDPPWTHFAQLVRRCLDLVADVADRTGRDREELFAYVHAQDRYAEQACAEDNQALYRECWDNLDQYAGYLHQLLRDELPRPLVRPTLPPEEEARQEVENFRALLAHVWKEVRLGPQPSREKESRLSDIADQARGLSQRARTEPLAAIREARRLGMEVEKVAGQEEGGPCRPPEDDAGLLEGTP